MSARNTDHAWSTKVYFTYFFLFLVRLSCKNIILKPFCVVCEFPPPLPNVQNEIIGSLLFKKEISSFYGTANKVMD